MPGIKGMCAHIQQGQIMGSAVEQVAALAIFCRVVPGAVPFGNAGGERVRRADLGGERVGDSDLREPSQAGCKRQEEDRDDGVWDPSFHDQAKCKA